MANLTYIKYNILRHLAKLASDRQLNVTPLLFPEASPLVRWQTEFIKFNLPLLDIDNKFNSDCIVSKGSLPGSLDVEDFIWSEEQGQLTVTFSTTLSGKALDTDSVIITLVKRDCSAIYSRIDEDNTRVSGQSLLNPLVHFGVQIDFDPAQWVAFVTFHRFADPDGVISLCSNSQGGDILT